MTRRRAEKGKKRKIFRIGVNGGDREGGGGGKNKEDKGRHGQS